jgi:hypothetical protein
VGVGGVGCWLLVVGCWLLVVVVLAVAVGVVVVVTHPLYPSLFPTPLSHAPRVGHVGHHVVGG